MTALVLAAAFFLALHLVVSGTRLRDVIVAQIGEGAYIGLFSLLSLVAVSAMAWAYPAAWMSDANANGPQWQAPMGLSHAGSLLMLLAAVMAIIGITTPGPTGVQPPGEKPTSLPDPRGIHTVTRHPFLWGAFLWAAFHLLVNFSLSGIVLFGTFALLTAIGTASIDAKRARALGPAWDAYAAKTSNVPFLAILQGRTRFHIGEIGWWQWLAAGLIFAALFYAHAWLFGVSPVPGWQPY